MHSVLSSMYEACWISTFFPPAVILVNAYGPCPLSNPIIPWPLHALNLPPLPSPTPFLHVSLLFIELPCISPISFLLLSFAPLSPFFLSSAPPSSPFSPPCPLLLHSLILLFHISSTVFLPTTLPLRFSFFLSFLPHLPSYSSFFVFIPFPTFRLPTLSSWPL